jgi:hypothetical protein
MTLPIPPDEQLDDEEWRSLIHLVREYQNDTDDDDEFIFWDTVIDKLYIYQEVQFTDTHKNDDQQPT